MTKQHIHFTADREINLEAIDKKIRTMRFTSRSEYLTACLRIAIGDITAAPAADLLDICIAERIQKMTNTNINTDHELADLIRNISHAVIAIKGTDIAFQRTCDVLQHELYQAPRLYENLNKDELIRDKHRIIAEKHGETR